MLLAAGSNLSPPAVLHLLGLCTFPAVLYLVILPDLMTCSFLCYPFSVLLLYQILSLASHWLLLAVGGKKKKILKYKNDLLEPVLLYLNAQYCFSDLRNNESNEQKQHTCFCNCVIFSFVICEFWLIFFKSSIWSFSVDTEEKLHH